ncbi:hypothetical protein, partial [Acidovorax sp. SUPP3334]|uniref:hypothetical protein n=1 Tax=Acidovorax sp. SUPP3334 TaxID=2920881 RepID=UPI0024E13E91
LGHLQNSQKTKSDLLILGGSSNQRNWRKPSVHAGCQGFAGATKQFLSHDSDVFLGPYALVNGNFRRCLLDLPVEQLSGSLLGVEGGPK